MVQLIKQWLLMNGRSKNPSLFSPQNWVSHLVFSIVSDACKEMDLLIRARAGGRRTKGEAFNIQEEWMAIGFRGIIKYKEVLHISHLRTLNINYKTSTLMVTY